MRQSAVRAVPCGIHVSPIGGSVTEYLGWLEKRYSHLIDDYMMQHIIDVEGYQVLYHQSRSAANLLLEQRP
jgi:hypothetical protein